MKVTEVKQVIDNILLQEISENNLDVKYKVLTSCELDKYRKEYGIAAHDNDSFYYEESNTIFIVIDEEEDLDNEDLLFIIISCYHEIRHVIQKSFNQNSYNGFFDFIDEVNSFNYFDYDKINHDGYSFEIGAGLYACKKAKYYMKNNFSLAYSQLKSHIELLEQLHFSEYLLYNASSRFSIFMSNFKSYLKRGLVIWNRNDKQDDVNSLIIPDILKVFLNYNGSFKSVKEIIENDNFKNIDQRIVYAIFSSNIFLKKININDLSFAELSIIKEALEYTKLLNQKQNIWKDEIFKQRKNLYSFLIKDCYFFSEKYFVTKNYVLDILSYCIRFNSIYKKDNELFRTIALEKIKKHCFTY